jgi:16S rRNA processing protein RimM
MPAQAGDDRGSSAADRRPMPAGRVGRAHGLDGGFYVTGARPRLLAVGTPVRLGELATRIASRRGTDERPILRVEGIGDRAGAEAVRGREISVAAVDAPALGEGEWWASELEGCEVLDGDRRVGIVVRMVELPSCEALEVRAAAAEQAAFPGDRDASRVRAHPRAHGDERTFLVPMVRDAIRSVDVAARRIDVDVGFLEG